MFNHQIAKMTQSQGIYHYNNNAPPQKILCFRKRQTNWRLMPDRKLYPCIVDNTLPNNRITTAKYNWFTFLPKNLAEQFSKLANVYFLVPYFQQLAFDLLIFTYQGPGDFANDSCNNNFRQKACDLGSIDSDLGDNCSERFRGRL